MFEYLCHRTIKYHLDFSSDHVITFLIHLGIMKTFEIFLLDVTLLTHTLFILNMTFVISYFNKTMFSPYAIDIMILMFANVKVHS